MKKLKHFWESLKAEYRRKNSERMIRRINESFNVTEKGGRVFLTHDGCVFYEFAENERVADIVESLNSARTAVKNFYKEYDNGL